MQGSFLCALVALILAAALPSALSAAGGNTPSAPKPDSPTYVMLNDTKSWPNQGTTGQWAMTIWRRNFAGDEFKAHVCNATAYGAPCNAPAIVEHTTQQVQIRFFKRNATAPLRTWQKGVPVEIKVRLAYMPVSQVDRGWRKKNQAYPGHGWHAKWTVATMNYDDATYAASAEQPMIATWDLVNADEVTDALLYPEVCVLCTFADGRRDYCQCDRRNAGANVQTIETAVEGAITPGMRGAAIALSIFAPVFLIIYTISDNLYYKKTGKSLRLVNL